MTTQDRKYQKSKHNQDPKDFSRSQNSFTFHFPRQGHCRYKTQTKTKSK